MYADSFVVGSPGPDSRRLTTDDVRLGKQRIAPTTQAQRSTAPPNPGGSSGIPRGVSPPPPSSKVKSTAVEKAKAAQDAKRN
jgi:hypothetical protein